MNNGVIGFVCFVTFFSNLFLQIVFELVACECECFMDHTLAHPLNCRGGVVAVVARLSACARV